MTEIYGIDNDTVVMESDTGKNEEIPLKDREIAVITLENQEGGVVIYAWYETPSWAFTVCQIEGEEIPVPWEVVLNQDSSYSMRVSVDTPTDVKIKYEVC